MGPLADLILGIVLTHYVYKMISLTLLDPRRWTDRTLVSET